MLGYESCRVSVFVLVLGLATTHEQFATLYSTRGQQHTHKQDGGRRRQREGKRTARLPKKTFRTQGARSTTER